MRPAAAVSGILVGGLSGQASPQGFFCGAGLPLGAAPGALSHGNAHGSIAVRDRSKGR